MSTMSARTATSEHSFLVVPLFAISVILLFVSHKKHPFLHPLGLFMMNTVNTFFSVMT